METITIPGGTAVLRDTLTVRQRRPLQVVGATLPKELVDIVDAAQADTNGRIRLDELGLTEGTASIMFRMQDASIVAFLDSWSLTDGAGAPVPLPTMDTVGDMPGDVYDAIGLAVSKRGAAEINGMGDASPDGVTDPESPTGPSST
jgi:hypothetical protein